MHSLLLTVLEAWKNKEGDCHSAFVGQLKRRNHSYCKMEIKYQFNTKAIQLQIMNKPSIIQVSYEGGLFSLCKALSDVQHQVVLKDTGEDQFACHK